MKKHLLTILILLCHLYSNAQSCTKGLKTTISSTTTITNRTFSGDVYIVNNTISPSNLVGSPIPIVTFSGSIKLKDGATIYVGRGTRLVIDNANVTSLCVNNLWNGIRVEGNLPKQINGAPIGQLSVLNSTISNAQLAIKNDNLPSSKGGEIYCFSSTFVNNIQDLEINQRFTPYYVSPSITAEYCNIVNCNFLSNMANRAFNSHIVINNSQLMMSGSVFEHNANFPFLNPSDWKPCIKGNDAFLGISNSKFKYVNIAIQSDFIASNGSGSIFSDNIFDNVNRGIILNSSSGYTTISNNYFALISSGGFTNYSNILANGVKGIVINGESFTEVVSNFFRYIHMVGSQPLPSLQCGIEYNNTGIKNQRFFKNKSEDVMPILIANGINRSSNLGMNGLYFTCNSNYLNISGFPSRKYKTHYSIDPITTCSNCGIKGTIATFNNLGNIIAKSANVFNDCNSPISYPSTSPFFPVIDNHANTISYYYENAVILNAYEVPFKSSNTRLVINKINQCDYKKPGDVVRTILPNSNQAKDQFLSRTQLQTLQDNIRDYLIKENEMLGQYNNFILVSEEDKEVKSLLYDKISVLRGEIDENIKYWQNDILLREAVNSESLYDEFYSCISNLGSSEERNYELYGYLMNKKKFGQALDFLNIIKQDASNDLNTKKGIEDLISLTYILKDITDSAKEYTELTKEQIDKVRVIASNPIPCRAKHRACNLLEIATNETCKYDVQYDFWQNIAIDDSLIDSSNIVSTVLPNPANQNISISFSLPNFNKTYILTVYDLMGNLMTQKTLNYYDTIANIDVSLWNIGHYYYYIKEDSKVLSKNHFLIIR